MNDTEKGLPELPEAAHMYCPGREEDVPMYTADQMRAMYEKGKQDALSPAPSAGAVGYARLLRFVEGLDCECDPDYCTRKCGRCVVLSQHPAAPSVSSSGGYIDSSGAVIRPMPTTCCPGSEVRDIGGFMRCTICNVSYGPVK